MRLSLKKILTPVVMLLLVAGLVCLAPNVSSLTHRKEKIRNKCSSVGLTYRYSTVYVYKDAGISHKYPSTNYGSQSYIFAGYYGSPTYLRRALIYFPLPSIPVEDLIYAQLKLYLYKAKTFFETGYTSKKFKIYRVSSSWSESSVTWNNKPGVGEYYASFTVYSSHADKHLYIITITDLVKKWYKGTYPNYGIYILSGDSNKALVSWYSGETSYRPRVVLKYKYGINITITPTAVAGYQGSSVTVNIKVFSHGGFSGYVSFTVTSIPSGYTYSFHPYLGVSLSPSNSPKTTSLTVNIPSTASTGVKYIYVKAYSGSYYDTRSFKLTVYSSGFVLSASPSTLSIGQGSSATTTLKVIKIGNYNKQVTFSIQSAPSGISVSFNPSSVTPTASTTATINVASSVSPGTYNIIIKALGADGKYAIKTIKVNVVASGFTLSCNPLSVTVYQGASTTLALTVTKIGTYSKQVSFSLQSAPSGITASFSPSTVTPTGTSTVTIHVASSVSPGTYNIVIKAMGADGKIATTTITITVKVKPFDFTISVSPPSTQVNKGDSATATITLTLISGTGKPITLSLTGIPAGTYTFNPSTVTPTGSSVLTINTAPLNEGTYTITIKATYGSLTKTATLTLKVVGFDYSLSVSPSSIEVEQGSSASVTVKLTLLKGSGETVSLSLEGLPSGATYSFSPSTVTPTGTSTLTINTGTANKGTYTIMVKAISTSGVTKTATLVLKVKEKSKCIIATVTYGSEVADEVQVLRNFRDHIVLSTYAGSCFYVAFNNFYYSWSPYVAYWIQANPWIKPLFKALIYPLIGTLLFATSLVHPLAALSSELVVYAAGTVISTLLGLIYVAPVTLIVFHYRRKWFKESVAKKLLLATTATLAICITAQVLVLSPVLVVATSLYVILLIALAGYTTPILASRLVNKYKHK